MTDAKPPRVVFVAVVEDYTIDSSATKSDLLHYPNAANPRATVHRYRLDDEPAPGTRWVVRYQRLYASAPGLNAGCTTLRKEAHRFDTLDSAREEAALWGARVYRLIPKRKATP